MKKFFVLAYLLIATVSSFANNNNINEKLLKTFRERFPNAEQVIWKETPENYIVNFMESGIRNNIVFEKNGALIRSTRYYQEEYLPYNLLLNLRNEYPDKKIFIVIEISTPSDLVYYIKLEDPRTWLTVKLDIDARFTVVEKFRKSL